MAPVVTRILKSTNVPSLPLTNPPAKDLSPHTPTGYTLPSGGGGTRFTTFHASLLRTSNPVTRADKTPNQRSLLMGSSLLPEKLETLSNDVLLRGGLSGAGRGPAPWEAPNGTPTVSKSPADTRVPPLLLPPFLTPSPTHHRAISRSWLHFWEKKIKNRQEISKLGL